MSGSQFRCTALARAGATVVVAVMATLSLATATASAATPHGHKHPPLLQPGGATFAARFPTAPTVDMNDQAAVNNFPGATSVISYLTSTTGTTYAVASAYFPTPAAAAASVAALGRTPGMQPTTVAGQAGYQYAGPQTSMFAAPSHQGATESLVAVAAANRAYVAYAVGRDAATATAFTHSLHVLSTLPGPPPPPASTSPSTDNGGSSGSRAGLIALAIVAALVVAPLLVVGIRRVR
jgi:hypothetical protein